MAQNSIDLTSTALGPWLAALLRRSRSLIGISQEELARRADSSSGTVWRLEHGMADHIDLAVVERVFAVLGLKAILSVQDRHLADRVRQHDGVHAVINGFGARRLTSLTWATRLEAQIGVDRPRGWIDLLGYRAADKALLVDETKTDIPDMGELQRSLAFYEREAAAVARGFGWDVRSVTVVVLALDTGVLARRLADNRDIVRQAFPGEVSVLDAWLRDPAAPRPNDWTIAMVDPATRGEHWLRPPILGRVRRKPAYEGYADAAARLLRIT
jgi:transcriptional regulator with XRE-family HTH domain